VNEKSNIACNVSATPTEYITSEKMIICTSVRLSMQITLTAVIYHSNSCLSRIILKVAFRCYNFLCHNCHMQVLIKQGCQFQ